MTPTYAVVPSNGRGCLPLGLKKLAPQVDRIFLIDTAWGHIYLPADCFEKLNCIRGKDKKNISHWWNIGLDTAETYAMGQNQWKWNVLVVNDDTIVSPGLIDVLDYEMRKTDAVLAYPNVFDDRRAFHTEPGPVDMYTRITGWCFMLKGEKGMRLDEEFVWWYGDDDLDWRCRSMGGSLCVPVSEKPQHLHPNAQTNDDRELVAQTARDREYFKSKWSGRTPH